MNRRSGFILFKLIFLMLVVAGIYLFLKVIPSFETIKGAIPKTKSNALTPVSKETVSDEKLSGKGATFVVGGEREQPKKRAQTYYPDKHR